MKRIVVATLVLFGSVGCSNLSGPSNQAASEGRTSPNYQGPPETPFCANVAAYSPKVTVSGSARYRRRTVWGDYSSGGLGGAQLTGSHPAEERPVRQAEVRVTDPAGYVVQCGVTNDDGSFSVDLPVGDVDYTIAVNSRGAGALLNASVLNKPEFNRFYSLTAVRNARVQPAAVTLLAAADGDVLGGAFNILDMIYEANRYLRVQTAACAATFDGCRGVDANHPLPKVSAYWEKGFNPNSYFGSTSGLSFYLPGYARLFILGGQDGDVDFSDTDHFDNSVVIHEYGHFLEDTVGVSDSPGGSHNGNKVIDPRLAWSEGWGNFFQAAVRGENFYRDTTGNLDGETALAFDVNLETGDDNFDETAYDVPDYNGEGNYREFSVTRLLWDAIDDTPGESVHGALDNVANKFSEIWAAFSSVTNGFRFGGYAFRNVGLLHTIQRNDQARGVASDWSNLRTIEQHAGDESTYGQFVTGGSCAAGYTAAGGGAYRYALTPGNSISDAGTLSTSHLFLNNRFYHLKVTTPGTYTVTLDYEDANHAGTKANLNLYIYNASARFGVASDMVARNTRGNATGAAGVESKSAQAFLPVGDYLINVNVYTRDSLGDQVYYNLRLGSAQLCPSSLVPQ